MTQLTKRERLNKLEEEIRDLLAEDAAPKWSGAGRPPVGTECEVVIGEQKPRTVCFVGIKSSGSVVIETVDGELKSYHRSQVIFRPIRTQAQREREEAISTAHALLIDTDTDSTVDGTLAALYDAGMLREAGE